jgi:hypothetical protein
MTISFRRGLPDGSGIAGARERGRRLNSAKIVPCPAECKIKNNYSMMPDTL